MGTPASSSTRGSIAPPLDSVRPPGDDPGVQPPNPKDPLHGVTLQRMVEELVAHHGWESLADRVRIRCFQFDPSVSSSLTFLRRTPWARAEVEALYLELQRLS
jgi:uncharacterized protein (DUF2132 family)